jgi:gamma-glutamyltranspeptidase/glutathione hydrolase
MKEIVAHTMADFIQSEGGFLTYEDLSSFHSEWTPPVSSNYRGYDVWELPPKWTRNSSLANS